MSMFPNVRVVGADETNGTYLVSNGVQVVVGKAKLFTVSAFNDTAGTLYLHAHDVAKGADIVDAPKLVTTVYSKTSGGFGFVDGAIFKQGIFLAFSKTSTTYTLGESDSGIIDATFRRG